MPSLSYILIYRRECDGLSVELGGCRPFGVACSHLGLQRSENPFCEFNYLFQPPQSSVSRRWIHDYEEFDQFI